MTHSSDFPPSPEYLARQADRQMGLDRYRARLGWTDAQFLAERDAAYVIEQRRYLGPRIDSLQREINDDSDIEGYMRKYHTDEG